MKNRKTSFILAGFGVLIVVGIQLVLLPGLHLSMKSLHRQPAETSQENLATMEEVHHSAKPSFLTCHAVRARTRDFLKAHYSIKAFDQTISERSFQKFFQILDPGKNFFLQEDLKSFESLSPFIHEHIQKADCRFIFQIYNIFLKRVKESETLIQQVLAQGFDFTVEEKMETDRKKISWANSLAEQHERWRKLIKWQAMGMYNSKASLPDISQRLNKRYALLRKSLVDRSSDEINGIFLNAFALSLDPHSLYLMPEDQEEFKVAFSLQLVGIGASLSQQDGYTVVESVIPGGAAFRDGRLQKNDKIVAVDSGDGMGFQDVIDMELAKVVSLIRGKKDTKVKLNVLRQTGSQMDKLQFELIRDVVKLEDQAAKSAVVEKRGKKVGVIHLPSFYIDYAGSRKNKDNFRSSANDISKEINNLKSSGVDGIVLDLRNNGGGDLMECIKITGLFIDNGSVVQVQDRDADVDSHDDPSSGALYDGPLAVLISKSSASASEILAGAIQDYGRGLVLGNSRTYGKATVQNVVDVPGSRNRDTDGSIKVTIQKFFRPSGKTNQGQGVESDILIPSLMEIADISESQNEYVLPATTIPPHRHFKPIFDFGNFLTELRERSKSRIQKSAEFQKLDTLIQKALKDKEDTTISLKIANTSATSKPKSAKDIPDAKATGTPSAKTVDNLKVLDTQDLEIQEASEILLDTMELTGKTHF
jgi:carboxyl-terminal processing protease